MKCLTDLVDAVGLDGRVDEFSDELAFEVLARSIVRSSNAPH